VESGRLTGRGWKSRAKAAKTTSAITAGTSQMVDQSWIPAGVVQRSTTAPDTKAPTK